MSAQAVFDHYEMSHLEHAKSRFASAKCSMGASSVP